MDIWVIFHPYGGHDSPDTPPRDHPCILYRKFSFFFFSVWKHIFVKIYVNINFLDFLLADQANLFNIAIFKSKEIEIVHRILSWSWQGKEELTEKDRSTPDTWTPWAKRHAIKALHHYEVQKASIEAIIKEFRQVSRRGQIYSCFLQDRW